MFDKEFFPTPKPVIQKLLQGINLSRTTILEPSAGKGDIIDYIYDLVLAAASSWCIDRERSNLSKFIYTIEKNPDLQNVLRGKGYSVVDSDFLQHSAERNYDLIVMNPPFSDGAKHFLHAFEIANGAEIRCLLNAETINNPYSYERQQAAQIIETYGGTTEDLGPCFANSERPTNVHVVLVTIPKRERSFKFQFQGNTYGEKNYKISDLANNQVELRDEFESRVNRFNKIKEAANKIYEGLVEAAYYAGDYLKDIALTKCVGKSASCGDQGFNNFMSDIREAAWNELFTQSKLSGIVTSTVRKDLESARESYGQMAFTLENVLGMMGELTLSLPDIRKQCIMGAFDVMTSFSSTNKLYVDGWKTNDAWMIKKKCIIPYGNKDSEAWIKKFGHCKPGVSCSYVDKIADIEKALCFVSGKVWEDGKDKNKGVKENSIWNIREFEEFGVWYDTEFFRIKFFKKGTVHLEFKDDTLWKKFNIEACDGKNWLPADYGRSFM